MKRGCPDAEELADYMEGHLPAAEVARLEQHLAQCDSCQHELSLGLGLVRGEDFSELEPVPPGLTEEAVRLVRKELAAAQGPALKRIKYLLEATCSRAREMLRLMQWQHWGLATVRGSRKTVSENHIVVRRRFGKVEAVIEVTKTGDQRAAVRVRVKNEPGEKNLRVTLTRGQREFASHILGAEPVLFEDVPFGHYRISLSGNAGFLGHFDFEVKESSHGG